MTKAVTVPLEQKDWTLVEDNVGGGGGKRGVYVKGPGLGREGLHWDIDVNPHDNPDYNKNGGQTVFYKAFATKFSKNWPDKPEAVLKEITDTNAPKDLKAKLIKCKTPKDQKKLLTQANLDATAAAEAVANEAYHKLVVKHLKARAAKFKVTFGGVEYRCK